MKLSTLTLTISCFLFGMISCSETIHKPAPNGNETKSSSSLGISEMNTPIYHKSHELKKQDAPFSDAVQVGNVLYLSGQIGMNHSTRELVEGGIKAETIQTLENIKEVLAQHNLIMTDVVKVMVVLESIEDFAVFNKIYTAYFPQKPARTTFAAKALARGAKIEIEVVAAIK